jgi:hypothetical protein
LANFQLCEKQKTNKMMKNFILYTFIVLIYLFHQTAEVNDVLFTPEVIAVLPLSMEVSSYIQVIYLARGENPRPYPWLGDKSPYFQHYFSYPSLWDQITDFLSKSQSKRN